MWHKQCVCVLSCSSEGQGGVGDVGSNAAVETGGVVGKGKESASFLLDSSVQLF